MLRVQGAPGGPHLLLQGGEALLRTAPRRKPQAQVRRLRRGNYIGPFSPPPALEVISVRAPSVACVASPEILKIC